MTRINPTEDLRAILNRVEQPGRYVGGEWGSNLFRDESTFRIALSFPDLYEVGMSNTAIKLLYGLLNRLPGVACERVFVPAPDFEAELARAGVPLYTLETGVPVHKHDVVAFSFGFELLATNVLTILKSGGVPLRAAERGERDPLVILGGPGATNPLPMAPFVEGVFVGEAEGTLPELISRMAELRRQGAFRSELLAVMEEHPSVWIPGSNQRARRAIWSGFGRQRGESGFPADDPIETTFGVGFPVPSLAVIQDHGVVEIMRGCPQGCRFCHAGVYYRPYRMKPIKQIVREVEWLVEHLGYREISLSSLSTGDYRDLVELVNRLTKRFSGQGVSFALPSLRVNSVTLPIFEAISKGKRSGLTFAVESADELGQAVNNKMVPLERVMEIAGEARARGWQHAKLYFMIGLPRPGGAGGSAVDVDADQIAEYVRRLRRAVPMEYIVNVGTFVPKPHTPFQWDRQLSTREALQRIAAIRSALPRGAKLRAGNPESSWLEGVISRGSELTADLIETAFENGARLDAWDEHAQIPLWRDLAESERFGRVAKRAMGPFEFEEALPWASVDLGVNQRFLRTERERAGRGELTPRCEPDCDGPCGVCNRNVSVREPKKTNPNDGAGSEANTVVPVPPAGEEERAAVSRSAEDAIPAVTAGKPEPHGREYQLIVNYTKTGSAAFLPHLALVRTFERLWNRIGVPLALTQGYHPKPKMSFGQPLPLGSESEDELVIVNVQNSILPENAIARMERGLPDGFTVKCIVLLHHEKGSPRIPTPMQSYGGSLYRITGHYHEQPSGEFDGDVLGDALRDVFGEYLPGVNVTEIGVPAVSRDEGDGQRPQFDVFLPDSAPGLGRILKQVERRDLLRVKRIAMYTQKKDFSNGVPVQPMIEYYRTLPNCVASVSVDSPRV